jgi:spermidine synthase
MLPWIPLATAYVPGTESELALRKRGAEFSISVDAHELMTSRGKDSEEILAEMGIAGLPADKPRKVLVGGLGMGFTLAAALRCLGPDDAVVVAELVPEVVEWNRGPLAHLAGSPLDDPRVEVHLGDVVALIAGSRAAFDVILLDVDNGPEGLTRDSNDRLYDGSGLKRIRRALRPGGRLTVWSSGPSSAFDRRLRAAGFAAQRKKMRARRNGKGARRVIWLASPLPPR